MDNAKYRFEVTQTLKQPNDVRSLAIQFSPDDSILCVGGFDGQIRQYNASLNYKASSSVISSAMTEGHDLKSPITSIRFRPRSAALTARNVILVTCSDGNITHWHLGSQKELHSLQEENETYCADFTPDGLKFATVGKNPFVTVYDEERRAVIATLSQGTTEGINAHSARIQQVKCIDENLLATAGWDYTVQIWDQREGRSVRRIFGPYVCGDALDFSNGLILTGSARTEKQLELWDLGRAELVHRVNWPKNPAPSPNAVDDSPTDVWTARFSPNGRFVAAGGNTDYRVFDISKDDEVVGDLFRAKSFVDHCALATHWASDSKHLALTTGGGEVLVLASP